MGPKPPVGGTPRPRNLAGQPIRMGPGAGAGGLSAARYGSGGSPVGRPLFCAKLVAVLPWGFRGNRAILQRRADVVVSY
jgi:hypothetical protein